MKTRIVALTLVSSLGIGCTGGFQAASLSSKNVGLGLITDPAAIVITGPESNSSVKGNVVLKGNCVSGLEVELSGDVTEALNVPCNDGLFSASLSLPAPDGLKNVRVAQKDAQGNVTVNSRSFQRDTTAPILSLVTPSMGQNVGTSVVIQGLCETGVSVRVRYSGKEGTIPCTNGMFAATLSLTSNDGMTPIVLEQADLADNRASLQVDLKKDTVAPNVAITSPAANAVLGPTATLAGSCESGLNVEIGGTGMAAPVTVPCASGSFSASIVLAAGNGPKIVAVTQADAAGNSGSTSRSFTLNATGPSIMITAPAENSLFKTTVAVSGSCVSGLPVVFSGAGWLSPANTACTNGMFSATVTFTNGDGAKNLIATQTNAQNLTGAASRTFVRDATAPAITIASPAANTVSKTGVQLVGTCETGLTVKIEGAGVSAASNVACSNGAFSTQVAFSNGDGAKAVSVSQTDMAGNSTSISRSFVRDSTAPILTITSPAQGTSGATGLTIAGTCEGTFNVTASGTGLSAPVGRACSNNAFSLDVTFSAGDGEKLVQISQTDAAGNVGTVSRSFVRGSVAQPLDGAMLYAQNCAGCHGAIDVSVKKGKTATQITSAIATVPAMSALKVLTTAQVQAIATALGATSLPNLCQVTDPGRTTIHRLNREEYNNTLRDLLGISLRPADKFPDDAFGEKFNNNANALSLNSGLLDLHIAAAEQAVDEAFRVNRAKFMTCTATTTACATQILAPFLERAFRRPVASTEVSRLTNFVTVATGQGESFERGIKLAMQAALSSPDFLYRTIKHTAPDDPKVIVELDEYELASRLSYFLWSSMPDDQLFAAAKNKTLKSSIGAQVTRMLADAKSQALVDNFASQWLSLHRMKNVVPDKTMFPQFSETLRAQMLTETKMVLREIFTKDLSPHQIVKADFTFVNDALAAHYGIAGVTGSAFQKVSLASTGRQGILGHASVSLLTSHSDYPSIIFRGKFVVDNLLCDPPPPPPTTIPTVDGTSELERSASRLTDSRCMACHQRMDPIGYALQGFDALGRFRTKDENGVTIDGKGYMPTGETFIGPIQLANVVSSDARLNVCVSKRLMAFALGRDMRAADDCSVNKAAQSVGVDKPISQIIQAIVGSDSFRKQRGDGGVQ